MFEHVNWDQVQADLIEFPKRKTVPGRTLVVDADFIAYIAGSNPDRPWPDVQVKAYDILETLMHGAGAERIVIDVTAKGSTKAGRYEAAVQREYQAQRKDREVHEHVYRCRQWIATEALPTKTLPGRGYLWADREADDAMAERMWAADRRDGLLADPETQASYVLCSLDKDLQMVPGLHLHLKTGELSYWHQDAESVLTLHDGKVKKLTGRGWKFFAAQLMMGDPADNIQGLPKLYREPGWCPWDKSTMSNGKGWNDGAPVACGAVRAHDAVAAFDRVTDFFRFLRDRFEAVEKQGPGFTHWKTGETVPFPRVLASEMHLLWMQRSVVPGKNDALVWLSEQLKKEAQ